jgi:hypothetical protein
VRVLRSSSLALLLALVAACSSASATPDPPPCQGDPNQEACLTAHYFQGFGPETVGPCMGFVATAKKVSARRQLDFFLGDGVADVGARAEGQFLQRYYQTYDLTFFTRTPAAPAGLAYALEASTAQLAALPAQVGIPPGAQPTAEQQKALDKATGDLLFAGLRAFVRGQSSPPRTSIEVVVLPHIASPDVAAAFQGGVIAGLGLSPALFKNVAADDPSKNLFDLLGLAEEFTPTLFVGHDDVVALARSPDVIVSHELGHAMGLQHTQEPGNLMTQFAASNACIPGLDDAEIAVLKSTGALLAAPDAACAWRRLFELRDSVVRAVLSARSPQR